METLFQFLTGFFWRIWPFNRVDPWEKGLLVVCGRWTRQIGPGLYVRVPLLMEIEVLNVVEQIVDLPNQILTTADGVTVDVSGAIQYDIEDVKKLWLNVQDHDNSLQARAEIEIAGFVGHANWDEITVGTICQEVTGAIQDKAARWGINVTEVGVTHLAESSCQYLTGDNTVGTVVENE